MSLYGQKSTISDLAEDVSFEMSRQTKDLIASNEQLAEQGIVALKEISENIVDGFDTVSYKLDDVHGSIEELNTVFRWGFSHILMSLGHMNDSLDELKKIAMSPSQNWAYEQYNIARKAFKKGWYEEALKYVTQSLEGYGSNTGYGLEYRFHFLLGLLRLGDDNNTDPKILDSKLAQEAFSSAGRYAQSDNPKDAAIAYFSAARAAHLSGEKEAALKYSKKAESLDATLLEARFQTSKMLCILGQNDIGIRHLRKAIQSDPVYAVKAADDEDISKNEKELESLIVDIKKEIRDEVGYLREDMDLFEENTIKEVALLQTFNIEEKTATEVDAIKDIKKEGHKEFISNTLLGAWNAREKHKEAQKRYQKTVAVFCEKSLKKADQNIQDSNSSIEQINKDHAGKRDNRPGDMAALIAVIISSMIAIAALLFVVLLWIFDRSSGIFMKILGTIAFGFMAVVGYFISLPVGGALGWIIGAVQNLFSSRKPSWSSINPIKKEIEKTKEDKKILLRLKDIIPKECFDPK